MSVSELREERQLRPVQLAASGYGDADDDGAVVPRADVRPVRSVPLEDSPLVPGQDSPPFALASSSTAIPRAYELVGPAVTLTVHGEAAPKGSRTSGRRKDGSVYSRPAGKREHPYVEAVGMAALKARADVGHLPAPYVCHVEFHMRRPARPKYPWPSSGGDVDKLTRAVLDGLTRGRLIEDDRHVVLVDAVKVFGEPRTVVTVQCVEPVSACEQEAA